MLAIDSEVWDEVEYGRGRPEGWEVEDTGLDLGRGEGAGVGEGVAAAAAAGVALE